MEKLHVALKRVVAGALCLSMAFGGVPAQAFAEAMEDPSLEEVQLEEERPQDPELSVAEEETPAAEEPSADVEEAEPEEIPVTVPDVNPEEAVPTSAQEEEVVSLEEDEITLEDEVEALAEDEVEAEAEEEQAESINLKVAGHIQKVGWQTKTADSKKGVTVGTTGRGLRMEAIRIYKPSTKFRGDIVYQAHVQSIGWQDQVKNGAVAGTEGRALRVEAIRVDLTGQLAQKYDVWYRLHVQSIGWMAWAKNGESAGTAGLAKRVEAIQIAIVPEGGSHPRSTNQNASTSYLDASATTYAAQVSGSWQGWRSAGKTAGTTGKSAAVSAIRMRGDVQYRALSEGGSWSGWKSNRQAAGSGKVEAIQVRLTGISAEYFDVYYRAHVSGVGWLGWAKEGKTSGSKDIGAPVEAYQVKLVAKGSAAPGSTTLPYAYKVSGDKELDRILNYIYRNISGNTGKSSLKKAYDYIAGGTFHIKKQNEWPAGNWRTWSKSYAKQFWRDKSGNCYRYSSLMCWLAIGMGYDASAYSGQTGAAGGGITAHCWVEVKYNGTIYILDPDLQQYVPRDFFWKTYDQAAAYYYTASGKPLN